MKDQFLCHGLLTNFNFYMQKFSFLIKVFDEIQKINIKNIKINNNKKYSTYNIQQRKCKGPSQKKTSVAKF